jgi:hypothetical protein
MPQNSKTPFQRQHKLALQGLAFWAIMLLPIALYFAARAGLDSAVLALLVALGVGMLLAAWVG